MLNILAIGAGIYASYEDLKEQAITILPIFLIILLGILVNLPKAPMETAVALATALGLGLAMEKLNAWQSGDTLLLIMYSAVSLKPILIFLTTIASSWVWAIAMQKESQIRLPYAPFLLLGFLIVEVGGMWS
ncbi:MAG: hypothetical protein H0Z18_09205 [Thermococcus sp.]|uniref:hypothetical protein n=1 Tax=Thermococcus sp. TaxID=35749 RepID=UPI001DB3F493|nr:hypothetical protein [Thermococcus sp.]MBO8175421.1 hypothetical protein [Thermococcus sp.]